MALHDKIRSSVDRESNIRHVSWICFEGEIPRVKVDSNCIAVGLQLTTPKKL